MKSLYNYAIVAALFFTFSCNNTSENATNQPITPKQVSEEQHAANMKATKISDGIENPDFDSQPYFIYPGDLVTFCPNESETKQFLNDSTNKDFSAAIADFKYYNSVLRDTLKVLKTAQFKNSSAQAFAIIQGVDTVYLNKSEIDAPIGFIYNPQNGSYMVHEGSFNEVTALESIKKGVL